MGKKNAEPPVRTGDQWKAKGHRQANAQRHCWQDTVRESWLVVGYNPQVFGKKQQKRRKEDLVVEEVVRSEEKQYMVRVLQQRACYEMHA